MSEPSVAIIVIALATSALLAAIAIAWWRFCSRRSRSCRSRSCRSREVFDEWESMPDSARPKCHAAPMHSGSGKDQKSGEARVNTEERKDPESPTGKNSSNKHVRDKILSLTGLEGKVVFAALVAAGLAVTLKVAGVVPAELLGSQTDWIQSLSVSLAAALFVYGSEPGDDLWEFSQISFPLGLVHMPLAVAVLRPPSVHAFVIFLALVVVYLLLFSVDESKSLLGFTWAIWLLSGLMLTAAHLGAFPEYTVGSVAARFGLDSYVTWIGAIVDIRAGLSVLLASVYLVTIALDVFLKRTAPILNHLQPFWFNDVRPDRTVFGSFVYALFLASNVLLRILHFVCDLVWGFFQILGTYLYWFGSTAITRGWKLLSTGWIWKAVLRLMAHVCLFYAFCRSLATITPRVDRYLASSDAWSTVNDLWPVALWFIAALIGLAVAQLIWDADEVAPKVTRTVFGAAMIVLAMSCSGFLAYPILRLTGRPTGLGAFSLIVLGVVLLFSAYQLIVRFNDLAQRRS